MTSCQHDQVALFSMIKWPCFQLSKCKQDGPSGPLFGDQLALFSVDKNKGQGWSVEEARTVMKGKYGADYKPELTGQYIAAIRDFYRQASNKIHSHGLTSGALHCRAPEHSGPHSPP
jgi:hypothetical protein